MADVFVLEVSTVNQPWTEPVSDFYIFDFAQELKCRSSNFTN